MRNNDRNNDIWFDFRHHNKDELRTTFRVPCLLLPVPDRSTDQQLSTYSVQKMWI